MGLCAHPKPYIYFLNPMAIASCLANLPRQFLAFLYRASVLGISRGHCFFFGPLSPVIVCCLLLPGALLSSFCLTICKASAKTALIPRFCGTITVRSLATDVALLEAVRLPILSIKEGEGDISPVWEPLLSPEGSCGLSSIVISELD